MTLNSKINLVDNLVLESILSHLEDAESHKWQGTMSELKLELSADLSRSKKNNLPGSPSALRVVINRIANRLRTRGVSVKFGRTNDRTRTRFVRFVG